jgi:hypothetical protein
MTERELRFIRGLRENLRAIEEQIRAIRDEQERWHQYQQSRYDRPTDPPVVLAELQVPESVQRDNHAESKKNRTVQKWLTAGTWLAFIAACIYAEIGYKQLRDSNRNFRSDERPWIHTYVDTKAPEVRMELVVGGSLMIPVVFTNSGKTPAFAARGAVVVSLLPMGVAPEFVYTPGHPRAKIAIEAMYPGTNSEPVPALLLQPGKDRPSPVIISETQRDAIITGALRLVVHGRIDYRDVFGIPRWLTFCYEPTLGGITKENAEVTIQRESSPSSQACIEDNKTDNN